MYHISSFYLLLCIIFRYAIFLCSQIHDTILETVLLKSPLHKTRRYTMSISINPAVKKGEKTLNSLISFRDNNDSFSFHQETTLPFMVTLMSILTPWIRAHFLSSLRKPSLTYRFCLSKVGARIVCTSTILSNSLMYFGEICTSLQKASDIFTRREAAV